MKTVLSDEAGLEAAARVLNAGGVAVIPTDTVYGLAARPDCPDAVRRLYTIKGRAAQKPIALLAADAESAAGFVGAAAADVGRRHWPGALTVVALGEGVRVPDHGWTRRLLAACGGTLRVTSANLSGRRAATDVPQALADVGLSADIVVDDGISPGGVPSTVVGVEPDGTVKVIRPGPVALEHEVGEVWYFPGWMRTQEPERDVLPAVQDVFPEAQVSFRSWDGDKILWQMSLANADEAVASFVDEINVLTPEARASLTLVGHSLGGRIVLRILARLGERGLAVRQGIVLGAAIPYADADIAKAGRGSSLPILALCNPKDVTLRYVYGSVGGEGCPAFGANGTPSPVPNVREYVVPADITRDTPLNRPWAKWQPTKDAANHHALFYLAALRRVALGEDFAESVMVLQDMPTVEWPVIDAGVWWNVVDTSNGWKLERNKVTGHARILDPGKVRRAWGSMEKMRAAFEKIARARRAH